MHDETMANVTMVQKGSSGGSPDVPDTPRLLAISGPLAGAKYPIVSDMMIIGRDSSCSICLDDPNVSRQHCSLIKEFDGGLSLVDNNSTNGTEVNSHRLKPEIYRRLHHGDTIQVCDSGFFFLCSSASVDAMGELKIDFDLKAASKEAAGFLADQPDFKELRDMRTRRQEDPQ
jgi:pSer/pThr/pTyr-binding forkhead associated (FHA) protein